MNGESMNHERLVVVWTLLGLILRIPKPFLFIIEIKVVSKDRVGFEVEDFA
jgi:hypothetical protein